MAEWDDILLDMVANVWYIFGFLRAEVGAEPKTPRGGPSPVVEGEAH
jgi:hypothetical protein